MYYFHKLYEKLYFSMQNRSFAAPDDCELERNIRFSLGKFLRNFGRLSSPVLLACDFYLCIAQDRIGIHPFS